MKKLSVFFFCSLLGITLSACNDDPVDQSKDLELASYSVSTTVGETETVEITSGNEGYTAEVTEGEDYASVSVSGTEISVAGIAEGSATVTVKDQKGKSATLAVTVVAAPRPLELETGTITVTAGATGTVDITDGNGGYTAEVTEGGSFASVDISGTVITVAGIAEGSATITVSDAKDKTAVLAVTVESGVSELELVKNTVSTYPSLSESVKIKKGNGDYVAEVTQGSTNASASIVEESGVFFVKVDGLAVGSAKVTVTDGKDKTAVIDVTVQNPGLTNANFEQAMTRTMTMLDIAVSKYFYGSGWLCYFWYNPVAQTRSTSPVSVWEYISSIEAVNSVLNGLKAYKDFGNNMFYDAYFTKYVTLLDNLYEGARYYRGPFSVTSYTRNKADENARWMVYAVNRGSYDTANTAGDSNKGNVYDDMMWLLREMLNSYRTIGDTKYLEAGEYLAQYCLDGWDCTLDSTGAEYGGITWGPGYSSTHACSNGPIVSPLVWLYEVYKNKDDKTLRYYIDPADKATRKTEEVKKSDYYLDFAKRVYAYHHRMYMGSGGRYNDMRGGGSIRYVAVNAVEYRSSNFTGLASANASSGTQHSYNQGTMLSGAADLYRVTSDAQYVTNAKALNTASGTYFPQTSLGNGRYSFRNSGSARWFDWILMRGFVDMYPYDNSVSTYLGYYKSNLDYAYTNYLQGGLFPQTVWTNGWNTGDAANSANRVDAQNIFSYLSEYGAIARYQLMLP